MEPLECALDPASTNEAFVIPEAWKNKGSDDVDLTPGPAKPRSFKRIMEDPLGFSAFIVRNMIAKTPLPVNTPYCEPHFSDFSFQDVDGHSGNRTHTSAWLYEQWINCLIDLDDANHPTCRKARWYFKQHTTDKAIADFDDRRENGDRYSLMLATKQKRMASVYQPFKVKQPGMYEYAFATGRAWQDAEAAGRVVEHDKAREARASNRAAAREARDTLE